MRSGTTRDESEFLSAVSRHSASGGCSSLTLLEGLLSFDINPERLQIPEKDPRNQSARLQQEDTQQFSVLALTKKKEPLV